MIRSTLQRVVLGLFVVSAAWAQPGGPLYRIQNFAGTDALHDGGPAIDGRMFSVGCVVRDGPGNLFVCDQNNIRVRKIDFDGNISTVAGNGVAGDSTFGPRFSGDGGPATEAILIPRDVAVMDDGSFYVADVGRVRFVNAEGVITTVAGTGEFVAGPDGVPATQSAAWNVRGVAVGPDGLVYFSESSADRIRRIRADGIVETVVGTGQEGYTGDGGAALAARVNFPEDIEFSPDGELCFADRINHVIRCVDLAGEIRTVAGTGLPGYNGDGPGTLTQLVFPDGLAFDADGTLYFAGPNNGLIRKVTVDGEVETIAGLPEGNGFSGDGGPALGATFSFPSDVAVMDDGTVMVADASNGRIRAILPDGTVETVSGRGRNPNPGIDGDAADAQLFFPNDVAVGPDGKVFIADTFQDIIREVDADGRIQTIVGTGVGARWGTGAAPADQLTLFAPRGVHVDRHGRLFIADTSGDVVRRLTSGGNVVPVAGAGRGGYGGDGGFRLAALFNNPYDLATDEDGNLYITDRLNDRVRKLDTRGTVTTVAGSGAIGFSGDGGPATLAAMNDPRGIAVGPEGHVYFCDTQNHRIRKIDGDGIITTVVGSGLKGHGGDGGPAAAAVIDEPYGIAFDADGYMYFSEAYSHVIRMVTPSGVIFTLAGDPDVGGRGGNGGMGRDARMNKPKGVDVDANGVVYFSDNDNHQVRRLLPVPYLSSESIVHAASFVPGRVAPDLIISVFGTNVGGTSASASGLPLPETLADASAVFVDDSGTEYPAGIFFGSRTQLNLLVPSDLGSGIATLRIVRGSGETAAMDVVVEDVAPGLFTANANGQGVAAGFYQQTGATELMPLFALEEGVFQPVPIDLGEEGMETFLTLFGTGWRNRTSREVTFLDVDGVAVPLTYEGEAPGFVGLDQLNAGPLPRELAGRGEVEATFTVTGQTTNAATVAFR